MSRFVLFLSLLISGCGHMVSDGNFYIKTNIPAVAEAGRRAQLAVLKNAKCDPGQKAVLVTKTAVTGNGRYTPSEYSSISYRCVAMDSK